MVMPSMRRVGAAEAVRAINRSGRLAVVITNQPVIARGECSVAAVCGAEAQSTATKAGRAGIDRRAGERRESRAIRMWSTQIAVATGGGAWH